MEHPYGRPSPVGAGVHAGRNPSGNSLSRSQTGCDDLQPSRVPPRNHNRRGQAGNVRPTDPSADPSCSVERGTSASCAAAPRVLPRDGCSVAPVLDSVLIFVTFRADCDGQPARHRRGLGGRRGATTATPLCGAITAWSAVPGPAGACKCDDRGCGWDFDKKQCVRAEM